MSKDGGKDNFILTQSCAITYLENLECNRDNECPSDKPDCRSGRCIKGWTTNFEI